MALILCTALAAAFGEPQDETQNPAQPPSDSSFFVDPRDGKRYRTVKIGKQVWMAENLNYAVDSSWCYDKADSNCVKYGRLYTWDAAMTVCPAGWRLPTSDDWDNLFKVAGGQRIKKQSDGCGDELDYYWSVVGEN